MLVVDDEGAALVLGIEREFHLRFGLGIGRSVFPPPDSRAGRLHQHRISAQSSHGIHIPLRRNHDLQPHDPANVRLAQRKRIARILFIDQLSRRLTFCEKR